MAIPSGIPIIKMIVKNGRGGPNKDSIPVFEDLGGKITGYLKTGTIVQVVDGYYPGIGKYRKQWNGSMYRQFWMEDGTDLVPGKDGLCEESSHLYPIPTDGNPEPEGEWKHVPYRFEDGKLFLKI